jgi:hypothetical protein
MKILTVIFLSLFSYSTYATTCQFIVQVGHSDMFSTELSLTGTGSVSAAIGEVEATYSRDELMGIERLQITMPDGKTNSLQQLINSLPTVTLRMNSDNLVVTLFCQRYLITSGQSF